MPYSGGLTVNQCVTRLRERAKDLDQHFRVASVNGALFQVAAKHLEQLKGEAQTLRDELAIMRLEVGVEVERWRDLAADCLSHASETAVALEDNAPDRKPMTTHLFDSLFARMHQLTERSSVR